MEIRSNLVDKDMTVRVLDIVIPQDEIGDIVEFLETLQKRLKMDRFEEKVLGRLLQAFNNPLSPEVPLPEEVQNLNPGERAHYKEPEVVKPKLDKRAIVMEVKTRIDKENKPLEVWVKESIDFGANQIGIKVRPKSGTIEAFYDWLVENKIINPDGSPRGK